jgi:cell division protein FtsZ
LINLDFADIRSIMKNAGPAWMSVGRGSGQNRAVEAARAALASPLLDVSINGSKGVLFNVTGGSDLTLFECNEAAEVIAQAVDPDANIIFGVVFNPQMESEIQITIIATGFTAHYGAGVPTEAELRRLLRGVAEDSLDVPSFLRRTSSSSHYPAAQPVPPSQARSPR